MGQAGNGAVTGRTVSVLLLTVILVTAAALRLHDLDRTSFWYDEAVSWSQSKDGLAHLLSSVAADNYPPLHNILLWATMPVLGDSETALRLPSALLGILAVALMVPLGTLLSGRTAGLVAAALLAVSPFHIWYSTEARMYALLAATGLAFLLAVLNALNRPSGWRLLAVVLSGTLFLYSHIYALLGVASVGLVCTVLTLRDILGRHAPGESAALRASLAMAASGLLFLPWLAILAGRARSVAEEGFWIAPPTLGFLKTMAFSISGSLVLFWLLLALAVLGLILSRPAAAPRSPEACERHRSVAVCAAYTAGPPLLAYAYSILVQPILFDRYLIAAWPGLILLASASAQRLVPRLGPIALVAAALVFTYPELRFTLTGKIRPEWREIVQDYRSERRPEDSLALYKGFAAPALSYYLREPEAFTPLQAPSALRERADRTSWLLVVHSTEAETAEAQAAFDPEGQSARVRRFGWGASGLLLLGPAKRD